MKLMSENPVQFLLTSFGRQSKCVQTNLSRFIVDDHPNNSSSSTSSEVILTTTSLSLSINPLLFKRLIGYCFAGKTRQEDLGRATWTFLHTLGAQYPDTPTRQQKRDVKELMAIISRMYPCRECADHFKEVLRTNPVQSGSHADFSQWLCHVHNVVNRSLGKLKFPCERVDSRWGKLECEQRACDLHGDLADFRNERH